MFFILVWDPVWDFVYVQLHSKHPQEATETSVKAKPSVSIN